MNMNDDTASPEEPLNDDVEPVDYSQEADADDPNDSAPPTPEELRELRKKAAERDTYLNDFQRARADYQNLLRRTQRDRSTLRQQGIEDVSLELFVALDQLDLAIQSAESCKEVGSLVQGITMVRTTFHGILERFNIQPILAQDQKFDPNIHEAVSMTENPQLPDQSILAEVRKGYTIGDKVLRPSQVMVSKNSSDSAAQNPSAEQGE